jgi:hypothetical protein
VPDAFKASVLEWVKTKRPSARSIEKVDGNGTDWAGSTESGFYDMFSVDIKFTEDSGASHWLDVRGEDMASLWSWVVQNWPEKHHQRSEEQP